MNTSTPIAVSGEATLGGQLVVAYSPTGPSSITVLTYASLANSSRFSSVTAQVSGDVACDSVPMAEANYGANQLVVIFSLSNQCSSSPSTSDSLIPGSLISLCVDDLTLMLMDRNGFSGGIGIDHSGANSWIGIVDCSVVDINPLNSQEAFPIS